MRVAEADIASLGDAKPLELKKYARYFKVPAVK